MYPNGACRLIVVALVLALVPVADAAAAAQRWKLTGFRGSVTVLGTRDKKLTCSDLNGQTKEEVVAGRYRVRYVLDAARSQVRVGSDEAGRPRTAEPLKLRFTVTQSTRETIRVLTPSADGGCSESTRQCAASGSVVRSDAFTVATRKRLVVQRMDGDWVNAAFLRCGDRALIAPLPAQPLLDRLLDQATALAVFKRPSQGVQFEHERQLGATGEIDVTARGRLTYVRR